MFGLSKAEMKKDSNDIERCSQFSVSWYFILEVVLLIIHIVHSMPEILNLEKI